MKHSPLPRTIVILLTLYSHIMIGMPENPAAYTPWPLLFRDHPKTCDMSGTPAFFHAIRRGLYQAFNDLAQDKSLALLTDAQGNTPLIEAAQINNYKMVLELITPETINCANSAGDTALHKAIEGGSAQIVRTLINHNADADVKGSKGKTACELAREKENAARELMRKHHYCYWEKMAWVDAKLALELLEQKIINKVQWLDLQVFNARAKQLEDMARAGWDEPHTELKPHDENTENPETVSVPESANNGETGSDFTQNRNLDQRQEKNHDLTPDQPIEQDHGSEDYADLPELITEEELKDIQQKKLIAAGDFRACDAENTPAFLLAVRLGMNKICHKALTQDKHLAHLTDARGRTGLIDAAQHGNTVIAHELINAKASVNHGSHTGHRAVHAAIQAASLDTVRLLCHFNADLDLRNGKGQAALAFAYEQKKLLEKYKKFGGRKLDSVGLKLKKIIAFLEFKNSNKMGWLDHLETEKIKFKLPNIATKNVPTQTKKLLKKRNKLRTPKKRYEKITAQSAPALVTKITILPTLTTAKHSRPLGSTGIIAQRTAGEARYMDTKEDEYAHGLSVHGSLFAAGGVFAGPTLFVEPKIQARPSTPEPLAPEEEEEEEEETVDILDYESGSGEEIDVDEWLARRYQEGR